MLLLLPIYIRFRFSVNALQFIKWRNKILRIHLQSTDSTTYRTLHIFISIYIIHMLEGKKKRKQKKAANDELIAEKGET